MGTVVLSGSGKGVAYAIGKDTNYGKISEEVLYTKPETQFQLALAKFGNLLVRTILLLTVGIFVINALLGHQLLDSVLFALAIAVGLTPELLPIIVTVSLSHGAGKLAKKEVVVKQLIAIENLGNMDVLCTDKTGTLTEGKIQLVNYFDEAEKKDENLLKYSLLCNNAVVHHKILGDAIDVAIWEYAEKQKYQLDKTIKKLDEEPFDFAKRLTYSVIDDKGKTSLIVRGAPEEIIELCDHGEKKKLEKQFTELSNQGYRVTAVATKSVEEKKEYGWSDVRNLSFAGFLVFLDTPKKTAKEALERLHRLNVQVKVITGDNEIITRKICGDVGLNVQKIMLGNEIEKLSDKELQQIVNKTDVFAKTSPIQKNRIVNALKANGHAVGYMGDGINDVLSLHSADVGISVSSAVDVAKDTASVVLLRKSLDVVAEGIYEGRKIFNNTIKYILMSTSSNFGNMFSAAGASFFLPFLPMTATQILLVNGLYDISQLTIPSDNVDKESLVKPRHWDINFIKDYMIFFGPISSLYDFATFGVMIFIFHAMGPLFQTGWFIESIATEILVVFVIRTAKVPFFKSKPGKWLLITCLTVVILGILLPYSPLAASLGLVKPPFLYFGILLLLIIAYITMVEFCKKLFLRKYSL
jgi:Mg2+-importing ATPase